MASAALIDGLARRLGARDDFADLSPDDLTPLPTTGLAHDHVRLQGRQLLARVPKQSQLALDAEANLAYQAACFTRAAASGHTPRLHAVLPPDADLPMGALIVEEIDGTALPLPEATEALAQALAALHTVAVPSPPDRPPLKNPPDPLADTFTEIMAQAAYIAAADLAYDAQAQIREELVAAGNLLARGARPPVTLIAFDAHPGNFLITAGRRAVLVDLEKARYGVPAFDLAHATLYTSTTWDVATYAELTHDEVARCYAAWLAGVPRPLADAMAPWLLDLRRMMWLWSVTWCAKWRVKSRESARTGARSGGSTEDWSAELSEPALVAHVGDRVACYLAPATIERVRQDWRGANALTGLLDGQAGMKPD